MSTYVHRATSEKTVQQFVADITTALNSEGFTVHNADKMAMHAVFNEHG